MRCNIKNGVYYLEGNDLSTLSNLGEHCFMATLEVVRLRASANRTISGLFRCNCPKGSLQ